MLSIQIEQVRQQTKAEKKRMAMAMRQKQLGQLGFMVKSAVFFVYVFVYVFAYTTFDA